MFFFGFFFLLPGFCTEFRRGRRKRRFRYASTAAGPYRVVVTEFPSAATAAAEITNDRRRDWLAIESRRIGCARNESNYRHQLIGRRGHSKWRPAKKETPLPLCPCVRLSTAYRVFLPSFSGLDVLIAIATRPWVVAVVVAVVPRIDLRRNDSTGAEC